MPNHETAFLFFFIPLIQTRYNDIPIKTNKVVHTGAKTQLGGLKLGLFSKGYQLETEEDVKKEPANPIAWHINIEYISLGMSFIYVFLKVKV